MPLTSRRNFVAGGTCASIAASAGGFARAATPLSVGYVRGISALPIALAAARRLFARQ
jgi:ABC-type nitrate/sulfonate/bicarbonate transport system substrate-binding protein